MAISVENRKIFSPSVFCAPAEGVRPLGIGLLGTGAGGQRTRMMGYRVEKKFDDIFSRGDTIHQRDRWTDGRTPDDSKDRAYA